MGDKNIVIDVGQVVAGRPFSVKWPSRFRGPPVFSFVWRTTWRINAEQIFCVVSTLGATQEGALVRLSFVSRSLDPRRRCGFVCDRKREYRTSGNNEKCSGFRFRDP